jgi:hypothetical protein
MKRFVFIFISSCAMLLASAQEEIVLDSIQINPTAPDANTLNTFRQLLSEDSFPAEKLNLTDQSFRYQPLLPDYSKNLNFSKSLSSPLVYSESFSMNRFGFSPFYANGVIFNQAAYRLNDRFILGGNSFGTLSVFDQPQINPSMQNMNTHGASMFLQYKVSKNFKIETRVNISNQQSPWEP